MIKGDKNFSTIGPYWAKPIKITTGRDQLGMQRTSLAIYGTLIQGITNLTRRIRYYSFYSWLIHKYSKEIGNTEKKEFNKFIRRGEFLYAFSTLIHNRDIMSIPGKNFIEKLFKVKTFKKTDIIPLSEFADKKNNQKSYWQYSGGAFGQYYLGPMRDLEILTNNDIPRVKDRGKKLFNEFENILGNNKSNKFISAVKNGNIEYSFLDGLSKIISTDLISKNSNEHIILKKIIIENEINNPLHNFRVNTIQIILDFLKKAGNIESEDELQRIMYYGENRNGIKIDSINYQETIYYWKIFQINEYMHYSLEFIFSKLLALLNGKNDWYSLNTLISEITKNIFEGVKDILNNNNIGTNNSVEGTIDSLKKFNNNIWNDVLSPEFLINKISKKDEESLSYSFLLVLVLFARHLYEKKRIQSEISRYKQRLEREDSFMEVFKLYEKIKSNNLETFINTLLKNCVVFKHLKVAYEKLIREGINTLKFTYENGLVKYIGPVSPQWTQPRIRSLLNFMIDLKIISKDLRLI